MIGEREVRHQRGKKVSAVEGQTFRFSLKDLNATSRTSMPFDYGEWKEPNRAILLSRFEAWLNTIRKEDVKDVRSSHNRSSCQ